MVERQLPKLNVAGSNPVSRSTKTASDSHLSAIRCGFFILQNMIKPKYADINRHKCRKTVVQITRQKPLA